jgi:hypothetical protein
MSLNVNTGLADVKAMRASKFAMKIGLDRHSRVVQIIISQ